MSDRIRVNYPALEDMAKHCEMVAQRLNQTAAISRKIAGQMQNGALLGEPGEAYVQALGVFFQRVTKLSAKYQEVANDIKQAIADMRAADQKAGGNF
ncbi:MAG: WXG100 family type VII secretion target [Anaerolineales bacterium]|nr:WXG100 family type VII secretion target [Anaerolineales bacterium]MCX7754215.1 WXG100 family type VII secretion target [Anaerolineales bacterium]MDW8276935.1 WXG100 family type VII secretion target [Anaerolineales bacterium]